MQQWIPYTLFTLAITFSPGPINLLVMAMAGQAGWRATLPAVFAACITAALTIVLAGLGAASLLIKAPLVPAVLSWIGVIWLTYMAWCLATADPAMSASNTERAVTLNGPRAAGLQLINPKGWMMALTAVTVFAGSDATPATIVSMALVFLAFALLGTSTWALMGTGSRKWLTTPRRMKLFNLSMAMALVGMAWWSVLS
ncbi:LysE family translocator [Halomonas binhaiensis]|uniref:LysE family translocator n=1 Tax=Halomonas binhaiensis TaxID=2562282 RepID=A0A5C1NEC4_9GAMM|nr:LysE family translocator [Halomonas binhaiensis]QEM81220.1 LysE family translocator [Halomonas binhaiensis]